MRAFKKPVGLTVVDTLRNGKRRDKGKEDENKRGTNNN